MIIQGILTLLFGLICTVIELLPNVNLADVPNELGWTLKLLSYGLYVFPIDVFLVIIGGIVMNTTALAVWAVVEWCYKKLPGVD